MPVIVTGDCVGKDVDDHRHIRSIWCSGDGVVAVVMRSTAGAVVRYIADQRVEWQPKLNNVRAACQSACRATPRACLPNAVYERSGKVEETVQRFMCMGNSCAGSVEP
jgi:hypothetical protein